MPAAGAVWRPWLGPNGGRTLTSERTIAAPARLLPPPAGGGLSPEARQFEEEARTLRATLARTSDQLARTQERCRLLAERLAETERRLAERDRCLRQLELSEHEAREQLRRYEWERHRVLIGGRRPGRLRLAFPRTQYVGASCLGRITADQADGRRPPVALKSVLLAVAAAAVIAFCIYAAITARDRAAVQPPFEVSTEQLDVGRE